MTKAGTASLALFLAVGGAVVYQTVGIARHDCEVCVSYRGRTKCRTVGGSSVDEARQAAITNACAFLSSGVTDSMACQRTKPLSEKCR
ncbi:MAG: hypothetical protein ACE5D3_03230 [Candidatus Binatia bacterium]